MAKKSTGGRVTPKGTGTTSSAPRQSARPKILAIVLIVLVLAGLVAGTVGALLLCCPPRSKIAEPAVAAVVVGYALVVGWNLALVVQASV